MTNTNNWGSTETSLSVAKAREIMLEAVTPVEGWESVQIQIGRAHV